MTSGSPQFAFERVIGASHTRSGKPCQDEAGVLVVGSIVAMAVADGHGTSRHADVGAHLAVSVALEALGKFAGDGRVHARGDAQHIAENMLRVQIVRDWEARVRDRAGSDTAVLVDYGSTLLFALATPSILLLGQLGDGDVLIVGPDGNVQAPLPADPAAFADETPSLCSREAWRSFRVRVLASPREETLVLLSTDGYSKSFNTHADFQQIGPDYLELVRTEGIDGVARHLRGFLEQVTAGGSGDDIALAMLYWQQQPACAAASATEDTSQQDVRTGIVHDLPARTPECRSPASTATDGLRSAGEPVGPQASDPSPEDRSENDVHGDSVNEEERR